MSANYSESEAKGGEDLLISIGRVMTSWQGVEYAVCEIYLAFFQPTQRDVPAVAYHAVRTFDARITLTDALISHFCNESQQSEWKNLWEKIRKRQKIRNAIAHGMATIFGNAPERKWGIGSSPYDLKKFEGSQNQNDFYSPKELCECSTLLVQLTGELDVFRAALEADLALQSKLLLQQGDAQANNQKARVVARTQKAP